jgi:hypothetical protein
VLRSNSCEAVESRLKGNLPIETLLLQQIFWLSETIIFFFRERFATPVSLYFVPGCNNMLFIDQSND